MKKILAWGAAVLTVGIWAETFVSTKVLLNNGMLPLDFNPAILSEPVVWGNLIYLGLVASLRCFLMWNWAVTQLGTVRTTNIIYGQCFFTMLIAAIVLGEKITPMAVLGTVILTAGMMIAIKRQPI